MPNMNSTHLKRKDLLRYRCSCHGNLAAVTMEYATDAYCPNINSIRFKIIEY